MLCYVMLCSFISYIIILYYIILYYIILLYYYIISWIINIYHITYIMKVDWQATHVAAWGCSSERPQSFWRSLSPPPNLRWSAPRHSMTGRKPQNWAVAAFRQKRQFRYLGELRHPAPHGSNGHHRSVWADFGTGDSSLLQQPQNWHPGQAISARRSPETEQLTQDTETSWIILQESQGHVGCAQVEVFGQSWRFAKHLVHIVAGTRFHHHRLEAGLLGVVGRVSAVAWSLKRLDKTGAQEAEQCGTSTWTCSRSHARCHWEACARVDVHTYRPRPYTTYARTCTWIRAKNIK